MIRSVSRLLHTPSVTTVRTQCLPRISDVHYRSASVFQRNTSLKLAARLQNVENLHTSSDRKGIFEDKHTKSLTMWSNLNEVKASPMPALTLGLSGLIPFVAAPCLIINSGFFLPTIATAQLAYGTTILSFLGGVRWGFTIPEENPVRPDWVNLIYSVTPPLIAWIGLLCAEPFSTLTVISGLTFAVYFDMTMFGYPAWFKGLRLILSFVAVLSLWTTLMCRYMLKEKVGGGNDVGENKQ